MERDSHPEAIYELLEMKVDRTLIGTWSTSFLLGFSSLTCVLSIATIVEEAAETVNHALGFPTTSRGRSSSRTSKDKEFTTFVERVLDTAEVSITDVLVTLVYMRRARAHLSIETEEWALHRVFLGALVLAHKVSRSGFNRITSRISEYLSRCFPVFKRFVTEKHQLVLRHRHFRNKGHWKDGEGFP